MIRALAPAALLLAGIAAPAAADPRLVERLYDPASVVRIDGRPKVQATIQFGEGEHIENVAIGDSEAWQVTPNKRANLLFVKPLSPTAATNMTVVTDRHTYLFDLVASPRGNPLYVLRFTYPEGTGAATSLAHASAGSPVAAQSEPASNPYAIVDPASLNFDWRAKGDKKILPERIYDDGIATFLVWAEGKPLPAILVKDSQGVEGPINFAAREDMIVIDGVPREIVLRSGKNSAELVNNGPVRAAPSLAPAGAAGAFARSEAPNPQGNR